MQPVEFECAAKSLSEQVAGALSLSASLAKKERPIFLLPDFPRKLQKSVIMCKGVIYWRLFPTRKADNKFLYRGVDLIFRARH